MGAYRHWGAAIQRGITGNGDVDEMDEPTDMEHQQVAPSPYGRWGMRRLYEYLRSMRNPYILQRGMNADFLDGKHASTIISEAVAGVADVGYIKKDGSADFEAAQAIFETGAGIPGLESTADATTGIRIDGTTGEVALIIGGTEELKVAEGKVTIPGLLDPTGLELTPAAANPGGTAANTLWADSGAGNRFKIGTNTVAYLSEVGTGDLVSTNNLSDLASDDTAIANLVDGATSRVPALTDTFPYKDAGDATGGKGTIQQIFDRIDDLNTASLGLSSPIAAYESGGKKTTPTAIYNLLNSLTAETAPAYNDKVALYDASASQTDAVTIANLFGEGKAVVVEYTGSGSSGKTVTLTGINRCHAIIAYRYDSATAYSPRMAFPDGGTGSPNGRYFSGVQFTTFSFDAPSAGTAQVLTINETGADINASGGTYRLLVIGTPT